MQSLRQPVQMTIQAEVFEEVTTPTTLGPAPNLRLCEHEGDKGFNLAGFRHGCAWRQ